MTESSAGRSGFDPRFDPAFQPGYDPLLHGSTQSDPVQSDPVADAGQGQVVTDAHMGVDPASAARRVAGIPVVSVPVRAQAERAEPEPAQRIRIREPFLVALWVVSVGFIVAGAGLLRYMTDRLNALTTTGGGDASDYSLLRAFEIGAPLLIVLGLATATGTLFLLAARRHRSR